MAEATPAIEIENAVEAVTDAVQTASVEAVEAIAAPVVAPVAEATAEATAEAEPAVKPKRGRPPKSATAEPVLRTPVKRKAKPAAAKITATKAPAKIAKPAKIAVKAKAKRLAPTITPKETIMAKTQTTADAFTGKIKTVLADAQERAKTAYDKTTAMTGEMTEFTKGNVEAVVTSGKILVTGIQDLSKTYVDDGKSAIATITADAKALAAVKSPTDFFQLQGELMRRNFDLFVATGSQRSEAMVKLANEAFAPLSTRFGMAMEKVKQAA